MFNLNKSLINNVVISSSRKQHSRNWRESELTRDFLNTFNQPLTGGKLSIAVVLEVFRVSMTVEERLEYIYIEIYI